MYYVYVFLLYICTYIFDVHVFNYGCTCFVNLLCINIISVGLLMYANLSSEFNLQNPKWLLSEITQEENEIPILKEKEIKK